MSDLKEKLIEASEKAVKEKKERRARIVKGSNLVEQLKSIGVAAGLNVRENTGFYVLSGPAGKHVRIAIAKRGGIVDFLSFTVQSEAVRQVSAEEAEAKHLGRVKGRIDYTGTDEETIQAFNEAVNVLLTPEVIPTKAPRAPRVPKVLPKKVGGEDTIPVLE